MTVPYSLSIPTAYGQMIVNRNDINQTTSLVKEGISVDHDDIVLLRRILELLGTNHTVIDIGANFGTYSLGLNSVVGPKGVVHAFEPQRIIFNMLAGSVALNALSNVHCHNMALGGREGRIEIPQFDYARPLNFGSIEFGAEQREPLAQARKYNADNVETVPITTLDRLAFPQVALIKIDAEGMEMEVLDGAVDTIWRCRPVLYIEFLKVNQEDLCDRIVAWGYDVHEIGINYLCIPVELGALIDLRRNGGGMA
jgi:FkbM family methyltransferase